MNREAQHSNCVWKVGDRQVVAVASGVSQNMIFGISNLQTLFWDPRSQLKKLSHREGHMNMHPQHPFQLTF